MWLPGQKNHLHTVLKKHSADHQPDHQVSTFVAESNDSNAWHRLRCANTYELTLFQQSFPSCHPLALPPIVGNEENDRLHEGNYVSLTCFRDVPLFPGSIRRRYGHTAFTRHLADFLPWRVLRRRSAPLRKAVGFVLPQKHSNLPRVHAAVGRGVFPVSYGHFLRGADSLRGGAGLAGRLLHRAHVYCDYGHSRPRQHCSCLGHPFFLPVILLFAWASSCGWVVFTFSTIFARKGLLFFSCTFANTQPCVRNFLQPNLTHFLPL